MAPPRGSVSYKKRDGILAISQNRKSVSWTPNQPPDSSPTLTISATSVTNLQQTPESSAKVMLKIFAQDPGQSEPTAHVFNFTSPKDARGEANAIKEALANVIQAHKAVQNATVAAVGGQSAAMTIANAVSGGKRPGHVWEDDSLLLSDVSLQQSLMREDPALQKTFMEARSLKPDSLTNTQFTAQFWSSRVHLLRAHAISRNQSRGTYNVFASLKREEGGTKMNLTAENVHHIFVQYPMMRRVYDEVVPKRLNEIDFWSRFFQSMLYQALRGLKYDRKKDNQDAILDSYLNAPELTGLRATSKELHIPKTIDLEGNEENHSQRQGNRPEIELRPQAHDKAPIIRTLNALSEKLMAQVKPSDVDPAAPIGMDEATYDSLRLRDLAGDPEQNRIILQIQDQSRFFSDAAATRTNSDVPLKILDPAEAIRNVCADVARRFPDPGHGIIKLDMDVSGASNGQDDDSNKSDMASVHAMAHIMDLVRQHRAQTEEIPASSGLSTDMYERVKLTHATTHEFLRQFWSAFLSGDPNRVSEITSLVESLDKSMNRIKAVADDAEKERDLIIRKTQKQVEDLHKQTGKRRKIDYKAIGGGAEVVNQLLGPVKNALATAVERYQKALKEQTSLNGD